MAVRRNVIAAVGPFDPDLGAGTPFPAEDVELVARASAAGWLGGYYPGPIVYHDHGRSSPSAVKHILKEYDLGGD